MDPLDRLEAERGGTFEARHDGEVFELPSPLELSWQVVVTLLTKGAAAWHHLAPADVPVWKLDLLRERWSAHYGLTDESGTHRLMYYLQRYPDAVEADLMRVPGLPSLAEMWRTRQWRRLLIAIDHLPTNSYFAHEVASDAEHAEMILRAQGDRPGEQVVPFSTFSPEVAVLADVVDAVRQVGLILIAANSKPGSQTPQFEPYPRPKPAAAKIRLKIKAEAHEALANRMLARRHKAASKD